eukprot:g78624.t1
MSKVIYGRTLTAKVLSSKGLASDLSSCYCSLTLRDHAKKYAILILIFSSSTVTKNDLRRKTNCDDPNAVILICGYFADLGRPLIFSSC